MPSIDELLEIRNKQLEEKQLEKQWYSEAEIIRRLDVGKTTLRRWIINGEFPPAKVMGGRTVRWHISTIHDWENKRL